jgi:hypothetical protein
MEIKAGEVLSLFSPAGNDNVIKLKVLSSEIVPLDAITAEEAENEGFAVPDFCASQFLCENIESRLDFEDYAFRSEDGISMVRTQAERELYLRKKFNGSVRPALPGRTRKICSWIIGSQKPLTET